VNSDAAPNLNVQNDTLCGPGIAVLSFESIVLPNPGQTAWYENPTGGNPILVNSDTLRITVAQNKSYWVEIQSLSICSNQRYEVKAVIQPLPCNYQAPDSICVGVPVIAAGDRKPGITYNWNLINPPSGVSGISTDTGTFQISSPNFPQRRFIYFTVRATNSEGCQSELKRDSIFTVPFDPFLTAIPASFFAADTVKIKGSSAIPYFLKLSNSSVSGGNIIKTEENELSLIANQDDSLFVNATVERWLSSEMGPLPDLLFCKADRTLKLKINVIEIPLPPLKPINNLLSANGDQLNPTLDFDRRNVKSLEIFDRWGKKVFETSNYQNNWKPESKEEGTFFYLAEIQLPTGEIEKVNGWVVVVK
jgi:hypothetical protein